MSKKKPERVKHIPQRTCVGCRSVTSKRSLVRLVKTVNGVVVDPTGKLAGRGVYLHAVQDCWKNGLRGAVAKGLKTELTEADLQNIRLFMDSLPEHDDETTDEETGQGTK